MTTDHEIVGDRHGHYSVLSVSDGMPAGWTSTGLRGGREQCLDWIANGAHLPGAFEDRQWWTERLADRPAVLEIPADRPRRPRGEREPAAAEIPVPDDLAAAAETLATASGAPEAAVWIALVHVLVSRHCRETDITLAFPSRFGGLLAHRVDLSVDPGAVSLVRQVAQEMDQANAHPAVVIGTVTGNAPLQVAVTVDTTGPIPGTELTFIRTGTGLTVEYDRVLYDEPTAVAMAGRAITLLRAMTSAPDQPVSTLPMLTPDEVAAAVAAGTGASARPGPTVLELIVAAAREHPKACALEFEDTTWSYAELDRASSVIATALRARGVGPENVVAVCARRGAEMVMTLVGILRTGAAYLPIDPDHPRRRAEQVLTAARPVLLVHDGTSVDLPDLVPTTTVQRLLSGSATDEETSVEPGSAAYVIFTSGSTGVPKGVVNTHEALANRLAWMQRTFPIGPGDAVLQKTPTTFDVSVWELFWPLTVGARLVIAAPDGHRDIDYLDELIRARRITVVHFVPSMLRAVLRAGGLRNAPGLRQVICSGEALTPAIRDQFHATCAAELHNLYGPTEAAIDVTHYHCVPGRDPAVVPIGTPIDGVSAHVLGPHLEALPAGVVGEIHLGGIGLARGYIGNLELTAERFIRDPHGSPGDRLYCTGDLGRRRADGMIEFLGRVDHQVALHGFRIELGEIESVAAGVPGVAAAVVVLWEAESGGQGLTGFVECAEQDAAAVTGLVAKAVANALPEYMRPVAWLPVRAWPTLASGKIDRGALVDMARRGAAPRGVGAGTDGVERAVVEAWTQVLGAAPDGLDADFFGSGGDSILSIELVAALRARGLAVAADAVLTNPTPRALAGATGAATTERTIWPKPFALVGTDARAALPADAEDAYPLSTVLASLVAESIANPDYRVYTTTLTLRGAFDETRLRRAAHDLLQRHPFLRTSVDLTGGGEPMQVVHREVPDPVVVHDWRNRPDAERGCAQWIARQNQTRFDWSQAPLLTMTAHRLTDDCWRLTLTEPLLDGWSVTIALTDLLDLYEGKSLPDPVAPGVHAAFLTAERAARRDRAARDHWARVLADPPLIPQYPQACPGVHRLPVSIPPTASRALVAHAAAARVSVKAVLVACHAQVVALLTGRTEVVTGVMSNSRPEHTDGARAVGMFLNTTPMRLCLRGGSRLDAARAVHSNEVEAAQYRTYAYSRMLRDNDMSTPVQTMVNYTHFRPYRHRTAASGVAITAIEATDQTYHPLTAQFRHDVITEQIALNLEFTGGLFSADAMSRIRDLYRAVLVAMAEDPHGSITPLGRVLEDTPGPSITTPPSTDLFSMFDVHADRSPDAIAVLEAGTALTFAQLRSRVEAIAAELDRMGVRPGDRVAVRLERSASYIAAVLAVLHRGAAYVPVDTTLPAMRAAELIEASGAVLTLIADHHELPSGSLDVDSVVPRGEILAPRRVSGAATAVVVFTSGSSGPPKGVLLSHTAVVNRMRWAVSEDPAGDDEVFLLRTPIAFVDSVAELFDGLVRGRPTCVAPSDTVDPGRLVDVIRDSGATRVTIVPTLLREMLRLDRDLRSDLARVRLWHVSGEPLAGDLVRALRALLPETRVRNLYGSSEVCADATAHVVGDNPPAAVPVGVPLPGVLVRLCHEDGGPLPDGAPGEVLVGGLGLADGYLGDDRRTADRFVPAAHGRWFRTGDLGVRGDDGQLRLLGRRDRQIKVRGVRVEPAEVEAVLATFPGVCEAVVGLRTVAGRTALVAHVRLDRPVTVPALRGFLRSRLPEAAVPAFVEPVSRWPRLPSGKVDVAALPAPALPRSQRSTHVGNAAQVADVWARRLGTPVDLHDVPDDLGATSLDMVLVAGELHRQFKVPVTAYDLRTHPTPAAQAAEFARLARTASTRLVQLAGAANPAATVVVLPFAGGDVDSYRPVAEAAGDQVPALRVVGAALAPVSADLGLDVAERIRESVANPVALLGHCAGTATALSTAYALTAAGYPPAHVFLVADMLDECSGDRVSDRTDEEIVHWLAETTGLGSAVTSLSAVDSAALVTAFRVDSDRARRTLAALDGVPPLPCPITVVYAEDDQVVRSSRHLVGRWRRFSHDLDVVVVPDGGHYLNRTRPEFLLQTMRAALFAGSEN